ncbi:hypothetical protein M407DRAFT_15295 [Tulasnella calospora MUT 4182]|uniref:ENTH domain-containing protein n=1 Tax=Tulasnella calospora MUT 4182 TaxID=1051891 RepID=A0A0C3QHB4_9AGAM|nr:hypothetical protein M407DRAFT_15295 [Tulasnella calospora MUT 4182]
MWSAFSLGACPENASTPFDGGTGNGSRPTASILSFSKSGAAEPSTGWIAIHDSASSFKTATQNYTKGYSDAQAKVRDATSNDPWGPSGTQMNELAELTYNQQDFVEIMEILDKRLNDKGKNWRHAFKSLIVLDYLLHAGSENVVLYFKDNIYVVKTLKEFQYIDEDGKDQGANVRQKAKDITNLLMDESRLREQRRSRAHMRDRMLGEGPVGTGDDFENKNVRRSNENTQTRTQKRRNKEREDLEKALALSRQSFADETRRVGEQTALFDDGTQRASPSTQNNNPFPLINTYPQTALFDDGTQLASPSAQNNNPFPLISTYPQNARQTGLQRRYTASTGNKPYYPDQSAEQQAYIVKQEETAQEQLLQQQALYEQQLQQALLQQQQQALFQQQQQQAQWAAYQQEQQASLFAQPTGYGSNNSLALAAGTAQINSPQPPTPSFGAQSPSPAPSPQPTPSPTSANTLANARRPGAITSDAHSRLDNLFANRDDGQDTFGNIGNLRYGQAAGKTLATQPTGSHNPFARQTAPSEQPFFSI